MNERLRGAAALLEKAVDQLPDRRAVVGLDGFVDSIIRVVERKHPDGTRDHYRDIPTFARRVANAAGKSTPLELTIQQVKLGGNGPIMANALASFGLPLTYIGAVGNAANDDVHPIFRPMQKRGNVIPVCPSASTDALEFADGKLMLQKMECLDRLDYRTLVDKVGEEGLYNLFNEATVVALNHWASIPHMTDIWRRLQADVCPRLDSRPRYLFIDLADPEKRDPNDIREALRVIGQFTPWYDTTLGLNERESEQICAVLDIDLDSLDRRQLMADRAAAIRDRLDIASVVVHPVPFAAAADAHGTAIVDGPYVENPFISTGAGDHFNAGYFLGRCLGGSLDICLQLGVGTSGHYVRTADSPSIDKLKDFLLSLAS